MLLMEVNLSLEEDDDHSDPDIAVVNGEVASVSEDPIDLLDQHDVDGGDVSDPEPRHIIMKV